MKNQTIRTALLLGFGCNLVLLICLYLLEYRVSLLESQHEKPTQEQR